MLTVYNAEGEALQFAHSIDVQEGIEAGTLFAVSPKGKGKPEPMKPEAEKPEPVKPEAEKPEAEKPEAKAPSRQPPARRA